jgi:hypothetical protein
MEVEDGVIWVYGVGEDGVVAFTEYPCASGRLSLNSLLEIAVRRVAR